MQNPDLKGSGVTRSARPILTGLTVLTAALHANVARADWGDDWGTMLWGFGGRPPMNVPGLDGWGLLLLAVALGTAALLAIGKRRAPRTTLVMLVALVLPLAAYATTISMPHVFTNGTPADATQVNQNLDVLVTESNDQDSRLTVVEGLAGPHTHPGGDITSQVGDADTVDGLHAIALEESAEIDADIAAHAISTSAHHTRYSDAEAFTAAAGVDAGTLDGIDSIALEESAEIDADIAAHSLIPAAHHSRYSDTEALAAAAGVDAGTLDGLDSLDFAGASHTHAYGKVAIVAQSGGDYTDPKAAMDDVATWCGVPSAANPCLVRIMPGIYDLGNNALTMQPYVDIEGSGEQTTLITSTHSSASPNASAATVVGANDAEIRFLSAENLGGVTFALGIYCGSASPKITNVTATATGAGTVYGVYNTASSPIMTNVTAVGSGGSNGCYGVYNAAPSSPIMTNVTATASGCPNGNRGVSNNSTSAPVMTNVTATASGSAGANWGVTSFLASPTMSNVTATASGATTNYGVYFSDASGSMTNVSATGSGGTNNYGVFNNGGSSTLIILGGVTSNGVLLNTATDDRIESGICAQTDAEGLSYRPNFCDPRCDCLAGHDLSEVVSCQQQPTGEVQIDGLSPAHDVACTGLCNGGGTPGFPCTSDAGCIGGGAFCEFTYADCIDSLSGLLYDLVTCEVDADCDMSKGFSCKTTDVYLGNEKYCVRSPFCTSEGSCATGVLTPTINVSMEFSTPPDLSPLDCTDGGRISSSDAIQCISDIEVHLACVVCGDGNTDAGETCDDGNLDPGDGCDANCQTE